MIDEDTLNDVLREGSIIDNRRKYNDRLVTLRDVIKILSKSSDAVKCAVGYFYLEGLALVISELADAKEIKILMGSETTPLTKSELISSLSGCSKCVV